jgi:hypothetical protein
MATRHSGGRRWQWWGPKAQGRRGEGEGHGHLGGRALEVTLTRRGGGDGSGDNPRGGEGALVAGLDEKQGGAREVFHDWVSGEGERKKWTAVVSAPF